jgi:large subunit ribosomal protein L13
MINANVKTYLPKVGQIKRKWHIVDANGKVLGRLATMVADTLRGKLKRIYCNSIDCGDFVVVTNASKVVLTGDKINQKIAFRHSGYPGGDTYTPYARLMVDSPEKAIRMAVKGMLPKNKLAARQITRLKVYRGKEHPHSAQFVAAAEQPASENK